MKALEWAALVLVAGSFAGLSGCFAPQSQLTACQSQNRDLAAQSRANWRKSTTSAHSRDVENRLIRTEREMASLEEQIDLDRKRLAGYERETGELQDQFKTVANAKRLPPAVSKQLAALSKRYPSLNFDPVTGISKLDTDILFDSGQAELKPAAQAMLADLTRLLQSPEAAELKIMVVGHTDNQRLTGGPVRERFPNNFHLSTARALAVADLLRREGLGEQRIGVAGFGPHQPVASNASDVDRQKNRRVEIFVMAPDVPVVGWTDSIPSVY